MIIRRRQLDEIYNLARAAGLGTAEQVVGCLRLPVERGDLAAIRQLYPVVLHTLADERQRWLAETLRAE